jgi:SAM-dependent methyltransferase
MTLPVPLDFEYPMHRGHRYLPNFWGEHYTRLPDIYHRFALSTDGGVNQLNRVVPLAGLRVLDLGSGTGRSAFAMARLGATVVGVDPEEPMREFSLRLLERDPGPRIEFIDGSTSRLPSGRDPFDMVTSFHAPFAPEGHDTATGAELRELIASLSGLLQDDAQIAVAGVIPGWRHEWMPPGRVDVDGFREDKYRGVDPTMREAGFTFDDEILELDYGSLEEALATYGFVYGPPAIEWLLERDSSVVCFGSRIWLRRVGGDS